MTSISELIKVSAMSQLQERVAATGICPYCHKNTMETKSESGDMTFRQCRQCLRVYVLPKIATV